MSDLAARILSLIELLIGFFSTWQEKRKEESQREAILNEIEKAETNEAERLAAIENDIRNDPDLSDELLLRPKDRSGKR